MGHIGITTPPSASSDVINRHFELEKFMRSSQVESLTFEKVLSGQGLVRLHQFLYGEKQALKPEEVGRQMHAGETPELTGLFAWYAGLFVAAIQLIFMPQGGIWISGGVALTHLNVFEHPDFMAGIEATPAYYNLRKEYPLGILINPEHALIGGGFYAASTTNFNNIAA
jgi:glucokinase